MLVIWGNLQIWTFFYAVISILDANLCVATGKALKSGQCSIFWSILENVCFWYLWLKIRKKTLVKWGNLQIWRFFDADFGILPSNLWVLMGKSEKRGQCSIFWEILNNVCFWDLWPKIWKNASKMRKPPNLKIFWRGFRHSSRKFMCSPGKIIKQRPHFTFLVNLEKCVFSACTAKNLKKRL